MEYITPNTTVSLMWNVPLDADYEHTIYFDDPDKQTTYFNGLVKKRIASQSYQRAGIDAIRVEATMQEIYNCNYLAFINASHENKTYYAFITNVSYVNEHTCLVRYSIDVMQTWMFSYHIGPSFIERQHAMTDTPGDNLVPESVEIGEYVVSDAKEVDYLKNLAIVMAATVKVDGGNVIEASGSINGGVYSGLYYSLYPANSSGAALLSQHIELITIAGKSDGIVAVFMCPAFSVSFFEGQPSEQVPTADVPVIKPNTLGGYTPKNKKLLTAPYNYLYVTDGMGKSATYNYEFFNNQNDSNIAWFELASSVSTITDAILIPAQYKGTTNLNWDESFQICGWSQCSYNVDSFKAWMAQNSNSIATNIVGGVGRMVLSGAQLAGEYAGMKAGAQIASQSGYPGTSPDNVNYAGGVFGLYNGAMSIAKTIASVADHSVLPPVAKSVGGACTMTGIGALNFHIYQKHIQPQFAKIIDDYFNLYGYATNRVGIPNRNGRPHWNYTKVLNLQTIYSAVPADDMAKIRAIYANGITWWKNGSEVGNYTLDNSIQ